MNNEKILKCFFKDSHEAHQWTFPYDHPQTPYQCPGLDRQDEEDE